MKTQITELINGSKNVLRDLNNDKYKKGKPIAGTNHSLRERIAENVLKENPEYLNVKVRGVNISLKIGTSLSGKTFWYTAHLSEEQFLKISGFSCNPITKYKSSFSLTIDCNMSVTLRTFAKKTDGAQWKQRTAFYLDESFIEIL